MKEITPKAAAMRAMRDTLLQDKNFSGTTRMKAILVFLFQRAMDGKSRVTEREIASACFDGESESSQVRVSVHQLRTRLNKYFRSSGAALPITITIPRNDYRLVFSESNGASLEEPGDSPYLSLLPWLEDVLTKLLKETGGNLVHFDFLDPVTSRLTHVRAIGDYAHVYQKLGGPTTLGVTGRAAASGKVVLISDVRKSDTWIQTKKEAHRARNEDYEALLNSFRSEIAVPFVGSDGKVVAVVNLHHPAQCGVTKRTISIVHDLFDGAVKAIENAIPYEAAKRAADWDLRFREAVRKIRAAAAERKPNEPSALWKLIVQEGAGLAQAEVVRLWLYDERIQELHLAASEPDLPLVCRVPSADGLKGVVLRTGESYYCPNTTVDKRWFERIPGIRSCYVLPLVEGRQILAVLCIDSYRTDAFAKGLREVLDDYTEICSLLISRHLERLEMSVAETCHAALQDADDINDVYRAIISITQRLIPAADGASLFMKSEDSLHLRATSGLAPRYDKDTDYPLDSPNGITPWVAREGVPIRLKDCTDEKELHRWDGHLKWWGKTREVRSRQLPTRPLVVVPIHRNDSSQEVVGVLRASGRGEFSMDDQITLRHLARTLSTEMVRPRGPISSLVRELEEKAANPVECIQLILEKSLSLIKADAGALYLAEKDLLKAAAWDGKLAGEAEVVDRAIREGSVTGLCAVTRATQVVDNVNHPDWKSIYKPCFAGIQSEMAVPLAYLGRLCGVLNLESKEPNFFTPDRQARVETLARVAAGYLVYRQLADSRDAEAALGRRLWTNLFTGSTGELGLPAKCGVTGYVISEPTGPIGGDFHDVIHLNETTFGFVLGDGEGHGVWGALNMLPLLTAFKTNTQDKASTKYVLGQINHVAQQMEVKGTAQYFIVARQDGKWRLFGSSAGHPQLVILQGSEFKLFPKDLANVGLLGRAKDFQISEEHIELNDGDIVIGRTDGVIDELGLSKRGADLGLVGAVGPVIDQKPEDIARAILNWSRSCAAGGELTDDATVVVLRIGKACS